MKAHAFAHTFCNPRKSKSGDASYIGELLINQQHYTIAIVCDGVSSAPKDWLASASVVEVILEYLQENKNKRSLPQLLEDAIVEAHTTILYGYKDTIGMLSTLTIALLDANTQNLYWANCGDSRIYGYKENTWIQLSKDDSASKLYKENGKMLMSNSAPILKAYLTKCMGLGNWNTIEIHEINSKEYDAFCLMSDGMYEVANWQQIATELTNNQNMENVYQSHKDYLLSTILDDASIALLKISTEINLAALLQMPINEIQQLNKSVVAIAIVPQLTECLDKNRDEELFTMFEKLFENEILFDKQDIMNWMNYCFTHQKNKTATLLLSKFRKM